MHREEGPVEEIYPGDVVCFEPNEKRWNGVTSTNWMTHIAIRKNLGGKEIDWMEKVSDERYNRTEV